MSEIQILVVFWTGLWKYRMQGSRLLQQLAGENEISLRVVEFP